MTVRVSPLSALLRSSPFDRGSIDICVGMVKWRARIGGGRLFMPLRSERPEPGHYRKASAEPWARKQVISGFLAQGSADAFL